MVFYHLQWIWGKQICVQHISLVSTKDYVTKLIPLRNAVSPTRLAYFWAYTKHEFGATNIFLWPCCILSPKKIIPHHRCKTSIVIMFQRLQDKITKDMLAKMAWQWWQPSYKLFQRQNYPGARGTKCRILEGQPIVRISRRAVQFKSTVSIHLVASIVPSAFNAPW